MLRSEPTPAVWEVSFDIVQLGGFAEVLSSLLSWCRFLRHVPVVYVDYPGPASLTQIYGTFNRAMLRLIPSLRTYAEPLTAAMVEFYTMSQVRAGSAL